ncbi:U-box domain-containing protein 35 [Spatholobus suberectus]|nr:U-box domain-containing protein 35 [Spatholobus suberectus]
MKEITLSAGGSTVIAVSGSRHSHCAVKWAVEHLLKKNSPCILIHVRTKTMHPHDAVDVPKHGRPPTEEELHQFFLPFRGFCARKGIAAEELVLHDLDVPNALTDYVVENCISTVVVGANSSSWSNLIRSSFNKDVDVPTSLAKSLPETCTLYVISRGKVQHIRPAGHHPRHQDIKVTPTRSIRDIVALLQNAPLVHPHTNLADTPADSEDINRKPIKDAIGTDSSKVWESLRDIKDATLTTSHKSSEDSNSPRGPAEYSSSRNSSARSSPANSDSSGQLLGPPLTDKSHGNHVVAVNSDKPKCTSSSKPPVNLEMEIRKLKQELKKTTEKYGMACKDAVLAKQKAIELEKCRQEKERNVEEHRLAEEAALALAEVERQKAKVAMESAEMSQRLAEMETQKRKEAELRAKHEEEEMNKALHEVVCNSIPYRRYKLEEIEAATNNFNRALKIGEGGYGPVFRGVLDHTVVAIKAVRPDLAHGERQFQQEVIVLSTIRHPSMVLLLGACPEYGCLVYEYMENGSLEDRLFQKDNTPPIPWKTRFKIASEVATGLLFLHQRKPEPLVHRDLKPANILLDKNYVSKISDVGLARLVPPSVANKTTQYRLTGAAGTFCYIDPEYQQTGLLGVKSDIYSLGVVLLQIITGKPPMGLSHLVEKAIQTGTFTEVLDLSVTDWPVEEALAYAKLALKCCELRKRDRPDLATVVLPELNRISGIWDCEDAHSPSRNYYIVQNHSSPNQSIYK